MTFNDAKNLLDSMLPRFKEYMRNINADNKLTDSDKNVLLTIIIDFERMSEKYDYNSALDYIKHILDSGYRASPSSKKITKNGGIIYPNPPAVPFLIKQVIFFIAVSCIVYKINCTETEICKRLNLTHNFFGKLGRTPKEYVGMRRHTQPDQIINYKGQKNKEWGIAIKNLVYQAGAHDYFIDIFGGTGAASTAVNRRNNVRYVYNDKDKLMYNLFNVIADNKLHKRLVKEINKLKDDLYFGQPYLNQVNFDDEIDKFYNSRKGERLQRETDIKEYTPHKYQFKNGADYLEKLIAHLKKQDDNYYVIYLQKKYSKKALLNKLETKDLDQSLKKNWEIVLLCSNLWHAWEFMTLRDINGESCWMLHKLDVQYRFYKYYAHFSNITKNISINNDNEKLVYAVACIFINSLTTNGNTNASSILRMNVSCAEDVKPSVDYMSFLGDNYYNRYDPRKSIDFEAVIKDMHKFIKGIQCENDDYKVVIDKYKSQNNIAKKPLFYSDSPYIATTGYEESFNGDNIVELIKALVDSGDKFIFSCRAVYGSSNGSKTDKDLIDKNGQINHYVFNTFLDYYANGQKFYVLVIESEKKGAKSLKDLIKNNLTAEIMITNFEIKSFIDEGYKKVSFTVYEFDEFIKTIMKYSNFGRNGKSYTDSERENIFKMHNLTW